MTKEDKYRWHDLRKNPTDLPESEEVKVLAYETKTNSPRLTDGWMVSHCDYIIAWKYIEPFNEDELFGKTEQAEVV